MSSPRDLPYAVLPCAFVSLFCEGLTNCGVMRKEKVNNLFKQNWFFKFLRWNLETQVFMESHVFVDAANHVLCIPSFFISREGGWDNVLTAWRFLTPHTHPTSRREGKSPLTRNGRRIAGSPMLLRKRTFCWPVMFRSFR